MKHLAWMCLALAILPSLVLSQIPRRLNYQGVLTEASGKPVADGDYYVFFRLYKTPVEGIAVWSEDHTLHVEGGMFSAVLGSSRPLAITFDVPYWLSVSVNEGAEMVPRVPLNAASYSLGSTAVYGESNIVPPDGNVGIGTLSPSHLLTVAGPLKMGQRLYCAAAAPTDMFWIMVNSEAEKGIGKIVGLYSDGLALSKNRISLNGAVDISRQLEVSDTISCLQGGYKFPDGTVQTTAASGSGRADNLGNHTAEQNIKLNGHWLSSTGSDEGVFISADSTVIRSPGSKIVILAGASRVTVNPDGAVTIEAAGDLNLTAAQDIKLEAGRDLIMHAGRNIQSDALAAQSHASGTATAVNVGTTHALTVGQNISTVAGGSIQSLAGLDHAIAAGRDMSLQAGGSFTQAVGKTYSLSAVGSIWISADDTLSLRSTEYSLDVAKTILTRATDANHGVTRLYELLAPHIIIDATHDLILRSGGVIK